ncbi:Nif3-like dinuclear metal center hexameric protein [Tsukamurella sp. 8F]|uniref:Nif3-like dinuclear metal center hexameric protein n=1 Tax=unclassified Tsukamurella TaxID=2633480 RepID=UPI0023BA2359|nr:MULTISPECIES: Nif3-like dinuclear metal center hexameric protein [unclassified Tsukamurella]MDF0529958.1 Nif3-like dinuclear metal center hexameric protein [Tsukamurella sp. 8J]MDF0587270.1 Nif3-like dinuclear metal center hexameric protein [Tsukamurella sp. 8F]
MQVQITVTHVSILYHVLLKDVIAVLDAAYPPRLAEDWDSVGLVCGDPAVEVTRVLVCVDVTAGVVDEALRSGAQLIVAHHPLLLRGVDTVAASTPKGALIHRLIAGGCALFTAHTNADRARGGVNDALASALGLNITGPIEYLGDAEPLDGWNVKVPVGSADAVLAAVFAAGAGRVGDYSECAWRVDGTGQFLPGAGARPAIGEVGVPETVAEQRLEFVASRSLRESVVAALWEAHPYEEPAFDVVELAAREREWGLGRIGTLESPLSLTEFTAAVGKTLGVAARAAGPADAQVRTVAVCGGAGDSLLGAVRRLPVDAYVTGDLRHHPADEHLRAGGCPVVDAGHWGTEFPWCAAVAELLGPEPAVDVYVESTDPFGVRPR